MNENKQLKVQSYPALFTQNVFEKLQETIKIQLALLQNTRENISYNENIEWKVSSLCEGQLDSFQ